MFNDKDNLIGLVFLALCAAAAGGLVWEIVTGNRLSYNGPSWLIWSLGAVFIGGAVYGILSGYLNRRRSGGAAQWPNPNAGQRSWWRRLLGR